jgi:hypothetical protein
MIRGIVQPAEILSALRRGVRAATRRMVPVLTKKPSTLTVFMRTERAC